MPLADGTILRADVYRPASSGALPALLSWSSHTRELQMTGAPVPFNEVGATELFVLARLSVLAQDRSCARRLAFGWLAASHRRIDAARSTPTEVVHEERTPEPLAPGQPVQLRFSLTPTANLFRRGERLALDICSRPDELGASFAEGFVYFPWQAPPYPARTTVYHGSDQPAWLEAYVRS